MAKAKAETPANGEYTRDQAEADGWVISLEQPPTSLNVSGTGAQTDVVVRGGKYVAEKTLDGHLITAVGESEEQLIQAIGAQQASIDSAPQITGTSLEASNVNAGDFEEENVGVAGALPETKVELEPVGEVSA